MKTIITFIALLTFTGVTFDAFSQCCTVDGWAINNFTDEIGSFDAATGNWTAIAPLQGDLSGGTFQAGGEVIDCEYFAGAGNNIYSVNTTDGSNSLVISNGAMGSETWSGLEVDPSTGIFYGVSTNIAQSSLWILDVDAGTATLVGTENATATCAISLVIDMSGQGYYIDICTDAIWPIDLATGRTTGPARPMGFDLNFGQDYSFDCPFGSNTIFGYAFNNSTFSTQYVEVDPTTGTTTVIQDLGTTQLGSMAFCIEDEPDPTVPTMGEWGVICLMILMLIVTVVAVGQIEVQVQRVRS